MLADPPYSVRSYTAHTHIASRVEVSECGARERRQQAFAPVVSGWLLARFLSHGRLAGRQLEVGRADIKLVI